MEQHAYNAYMRYVMSIPAGVDCPAGCEVTTEPLPAHPWPDKCWPFFIDEKWELVKIAQ